MPKLLSSRKVIRILEQNGFAFVSQKGSHKKFRKERKTVIVPDRKREIPRGTLASIVRQSGIDKDDFDTGS